MNPKHLRSLCMQRNQNNLTYSRHCRFVISGTLDNGWYPWLQPTRSELLLELWITQHAIPKTLHTLYLIFWVFLNTPIQSSGINSELNFEIIWNKSKRLLDLLFASGQSNMLLLIKRSQSYFGYIGQNTSRSQKIHLMYETFLRTLLKLL